METLSAWLGKIGLATVSAVAKAFFSELAGAWKSYFQNLQQTADAKQAGRTEAERDQAIAGARAADEMAAIAANQPDNAEALRRLREGSA